MVFDPEAIQGFLNRDVAYVPEFKGMAPDRLHAMIKARTGVAYQPKTKPRPYQLEGVALALLIQRSLLLFGMRMGKTKMAFDFASHLRHAGMWRGKGLIIAHSPVGVDDWERQAPIHSDLRCEFLRSGKGSGARLMDMLAGDADLIVVTWSTIQHLFSEERLNRKKKMTLYADKQALLDASEFFTLGIIDEIDMCQDQTSLRFLIAEGLLQNCKFRLGITGTLIGRNPLVVWPQAYLIDEGKTLGRNYYFFEAAFTKKEKFYTGKGTVRTRHVFDKEKLPILQKKLASISMSYEMAEVKNIEVIRDTIELRMIGDQREAYAEQLEELLKLRDSEEEAIENRFMTMRQISAGFVPYYDAEGKRCFAPLQQNAKMEWLADLLEHMPGNVQGIIFHEFIRSGEMIAALMCKLKITHRWLHGAAKGKKELVDDFQSGKAQWLVANTGSGSRAVDLPMADYMLFYESPLSPKVRAQAEARPMSRTTPLVIDDLVCSPVDRKILSYIKEGRDLLHDLVSARKDLSLFDR